MRANIGNIRVVPVWGVLMYRALSLEDTPDKALNQPHLAYRCATKEKALTIASQERENCPQNCVPRHYHVIRAVQVDMPVALIEVTPGEFYTEQN